MFDSIIVGAGPAGSTAARYLAKNGFSVCLVDKDQFPRDKPCGGAFSPELVKHYPYLSSKVSEFMKFESNIGVLHSLRNHIAVKAKVKLALVLRTDFDRVLFEDAVDNGVTPKTGFRAKHISIINDKVLVQLSKGEEIRGKSVIGADGVNSIVARNFGLNKRWKANSITACKVVEIPAHESEIVDYYTEDREYHFFPNLGSQPGYGWIFPKLDTVNVGLGFVGKHAIGLPRHFLAFVKLLKHKGLLMANANISGAKGALVPTGGTLKKTYANRCLLVGDSAGMVSPLTGGGIAWAMRAAKMACQILAEGLEENQLDEKHLFAYQKMWESDFGRSIGPQLIAQKILTTPVFDVLFQISLKSKRLQDAVADALSGI